MPLPPKDMNRQLYITLLQTHRVAGKLQGVEPASRVQGVEALAKWPTINPVALHSAHQQHLHSCGISGPCGLMLHS